MRGDYFKKHTKKVYFSDTERGEGIERVNLRSRLRRGSAEGEKVEREAKFVGAGQWAMRTVL